MKRTSFPKLKVFVLCFLLLSVFLFAGGEKEKEAEEVTAIGEESYEVIIFSTPAGTSAYTNCIWLTDMINKHSSWLKASMIEGKSPASNMKRVVTKPELRKTAIWFHTLTAHAEALVKNPMFVDVDYDFNEIRYLMRLGVVGQGLMTLDPKLRSFADLKGKRICATYINMPTCEQLRAEFALEEAGISKDEVKWEFMTYTAGDDALKDGLIDAMVVGVTLIDPPDKWIVSGHTLEVIDTKHTYFISYEPQVVDKMRKELRVPYYPMVVPANTASNQTEPWYVAAFHLTFAITSEMPDRVVAEIMRVLYDNMESLVEYSPSQKGITKETMGLMGENFEFYHPVALEFYKEKGVPVGIWVK